MVSFLPQYHFREERTETKEKRHKNKKKGKKTSNKTKVIKISQYADDPSFYLK